MLENGIMGFGWHYVLTHPWVLVKESAHRIKWAWQRVFRGWDDRVVWGIDYYLSKHMPIWLRTLRDKKQGIPASFLGPDNDLDKAEERWDAALDAMIDGFDAAREIQDLGYSPLHEEVLATLQDRFARGFQVFKENYFSLWD